MLKDIKSKAKLNVVGSLASQLIQLASVPLLLTIYSPDQYGEFALVYGISVICAVFLLLRIEVYFPKISFRHSVILFGLIIIFLTTCTLLIYILSQNLLIPKFNDQFSSPFEFIILAMYGHALVTMIQFFMYGQNKVLLGMIIKNCYIIGTIALQFFYYFFFDLNLGIITNQLILALVSTQLIIVLCHIKLLKKTLLLGLKDRNKKDIVYAFLKGHSVWDAPGALMNTLSMHGPVIFIGLIYGNASAGIYSVAQRVIQAPAALFTFPVVEVIRSETRSMILDRRPLNQFFFKISMQMTCLGLVSATFISISVFLLEPVFSEYNWDDTVDIILILSPLIFIRMSAAPISWCFYLFDRQPLNLLIQSMLVIVIAIGFMTTSDFSYLVIFISISFSLFYICQILVSRHILDSYEKQLGHI